MILFPREHETIHSVGLALRGGRTTCVDVLEWCLDRVDEWEDRVHAWVVIDRDGAIAEARARDEELAAGSCRGPLHGIPIGVKDIIDVEGFPTAAGFEPWKGRVATRDAGIVAGLRSAGAVILGKTVTTQFAWIDPPPT
ncbi:amidase family protein, partial [Singulisphaera rosea]